MKTKTHFAFRIDIWDDTGDSIVEHVGGVDDFEVAEATYRAVKRLGSPYRSGRSRDWLKMKNPSAPAVNDGSTWRLRL
jgi:hypothetical protein